MRSSSFPVVPLRVDVVEKPVAGVKPVALGGPHGKAHRRSGLFEREPDKRVVPHDLGLAEVMGREPRERFVEFDQLVIVELRGGDVEARDIRTVLLPLATATPGTMAVRFMLSLPRSGANLSLLP
jgi:hypothetical protein